MKGTKGLFRSGAIASSMLLMIALSLMVLAGCDDGTKESEGKTVTFTLAKASATSFTVTVDGADWKNPFVPDDSIILYPELTGTFYSSTVDVNHGHFDYIISGKVLTATLQSAYSNLTGTLKLNEEGLNEFTGGASATDGGRPKAYGGTTTYVGKPAEGITF